VILTVFINYILQFVINIIMNISKIFDIGPSPISDAVKGSF